MPKSSEEVTAWHDRLTHPTFTHFIIFIYTIYIYCNMNSNMNRFHSLWGHIEFCLHLLTPFALLQAVCGFVIVPFCYCQYIFCSVGSASYARHLNVECAYMRSYAWHFLHFCLVEKAQMKIERKLNRVKRCSWNWLIK